MACPCSFQQQYSFGGQEFLKHNVTEDKTWIHHHTFRVKMGQYGMETSWVPTNKEVQIVKASMVTVTLVIVIMLWDEKGVSVIVYMHKGKANNSASY
jgi:hypothetical protein